MSLIRVAAFAVLVSVGGAAAQDPTGVWRTETNDEGNWGLVEISACGANLCGVMIDTNSDDRSSVGLQIIKDMVPDGDGEWDDGEIYAPDDEEWYDADMELVSATELEVAGCVLGGLICRSQTWTREE